MTTALNRCGACGLNFGSIKAFDEHRVGRHAYTFREGLKLDPPREDGRRCLDPEELLQRGWRPDQRGRWRTPRRGAFLGGAQREIPASEEQG